MALVGSAHVLGPMEIVPHASATRVFLLTCVFFGSQWPYMLFFQLGHLLRARTSTPITFSILLLLVAAAPFNYDRLVSVREGAINANPYVRGLAHAAGVAARAGGVAPLLGTTSITPKQTIVTAWWGLLLASFWMLIVIQRQSEASDRAAFASEVACASASASSSSAPLPPPPVIKDTFAPCAWLFCVCPLLLMADIVAAGGLDVKQGV